MALVSEKSRRWIIAGMMGFLTIAFALPSWFSGHSSGREDSVKGVIFGKDTVTELELLRAKEDVDTLLRLPSKTTRNLPVLARLILGDARQYQYMRPDLQMLARASVDQGLSDLVRNPLVFALLKREALHTGIRPGSDRIESILRNDIQLPETAGPEFVRAVQQAVTDLVLVETLADQMAQAIKVTRPQVLNQAAMDFQSLRVLVLPIDDAEFVKQVPPPTDEQVRDHFNKWGSHAANEPDYRVNPFGFGYEQGDRIRLQYLIVSRGELLRVARASRSDYDWEVEANKYYAKNQSQFERKDVSGTGGGVRPFAEVRQEILNRLIDTKADQLAQVVQRRITALLSMDYRAYAEAVNKKQPAPATALGMAYDTGDYLRAVAGKVEGETQVRVSVIDYADRYLSASQLEKDTPIGRATADINDRRGIAFADFIIARIRPFFDKLSPTARIGLTPLELSEPAPAFTDEQGSIYFARVPDAAPARIPKLQEVEADVKADVIAVGAHERATAVAQTWAGESKNLFLTALAESKGKKAVLVPALRQGIELPPELTMSPVSRQMLLEGAFSLLREDPSAVRPRVAVSLPRDRKVAIVELQDVERLAQRADPQTLELQTLHEIRTAESLGFLVNFFRQDNVFARTKWTPSATGKVEQPLPQ